MADSITGTPNSEKNGTKFVVILTSLIAVLAPITEMLDKAGAIIPPSQKGIGLWIALASVVVGGITQSIYTLSRSYVKGQALVSGQPQVPATGTPKPPSP